LEGVGLAASRQRTGRSSGRFGFSWRTAVSLRKPRFWLLVFLGVSLDSVRIETYQKVTRENLRKNSAGAFPRR
jgi:hypothetical protein